jgi:hypothetical protein
MMRWDAPRSRRASAFLASLALLASCAAPPSSSKASAAADGGSAGSQDAGSSSTDRAEPAPATAVKSPVLSNDACEKDEDCAPAAKCHPAECRNRSQLGPAPDLICTMECRAGTADCGYNHCGCARSPSGKTVCALLPGGR